MKLLKYVGLMFMMICCFLFIKEAEVLANPVQVHLDGCDGTFKTGDGYDMFDDGVWVEPGSTLAAFGYSMENPTCIS